MKTGEMVVDVPAFATVRREKGVTVLRIRAVWSRWLPFGMAGLFAASVAVFVTAIIAAQAKSAGGLIIAAAVVTGIIAFLVFLHSVALIAFTRLFGEIVYDGNTLRFRETGWCFQFPVDEILAIRHVIAPRSRLEIDTAAPPRGLFFLGRASWIEVQVAAGRIRFFGAWEQPKLAWLLRQLCELPPLEGLIETESAPADDNGPTVIANHLYGWPRRALIALGFIAAIGMTSMGGWNAYRAASTLHWPTTQGKVTRSHYEIEDSGKDRHYVAEISYDYRAMGSDFQSSEIGVLRGNDEAAVKDFIVNHPQGSTVTVYYNPNRAADAILLPATGLFGWLMIAAMLLPWWVLLIPVVLQTNTREQAILAAQYKVAAPPRPDDSDQLLATIRWSTPLNVWREQVHHQKRADLASAIRVMLITALIIAGINHWLGAYVPPGLAWVWICWGMVGVAGGLFIAQALLPRHGPPTFAITEKGILRPSKEKPLISWTNLVSFMVEADGSSRRDRILIVCHREGYEIEFPLPPDAPGDEVIAEVATRLPQAPPPPSASPVRRSDWLIAWTLTGVFSAAMVWFIVSKPEFFDGNTVLMIWVGTLLAGPGTWVHLYLRRRRGKLPLMRLSIACNLAAGIALAMALVVSSVAKLQTPTQPPLVQRHVSSFHR